MLQFEHYLDKFVSILKNLGLGICILTRDQVHAELIRMSLKACVLDIVNPEFET